MRLGAIVVRVVVGEVPVWEDMPQVHDATATLTPLSYQRFPGDCPHGIRLDCQQERPRTSERRASGMPRERGPQLARPALRIRSRTSSKSALSFDALSVRPRVRRNHHPTIAPKEMTNAPTKPMTRPSQKFTRRSPLGGNGGAPQGSSSADKTGDDTRAGAAPVVWGPAVARSIGK